MGRRSRKAAVFCQFLKDQPPLVLPSLHFRREHLFFLRIHQVRMSSLQECPCAEGYWPQIDPPMYSIKEQGIHFGCCPGRGVSACGPQKATIRTYAEVSSSLCLLGILLTTLVIHYRQPQAWRIKSGDSAIENAPLVHDGAQLHAARHPTSKD